MKNNMNFKIALLMLIFFILLCFSLSAGKPNTTVAQKSILIISSQKYYSGNSNDVYSDILKNLTVKFPDLVIYQEGFSNKNISDANPLNLQKEYFIQKYKNKKIDIILVVGRIAFNFILNSQNEHFKIIPTVFFLTNYSKKNLLKILPYNFVGTISTADVPANIKTIISVKPQIKEIIVLCKNNLVYQEISNQIDSIQISLKKKVVLKLSPTLPFIEMQNYLNKIKKSSAVLFINYSNELNNKKLTSKLSAPVFGIQEKQLDYNILGGKLICTQNQIDTTMKFIKQLLNNNKNYPSKNINFIKNEYIFNKKQLNKHKISINNLPGKIKILEKEHTFYADNKVIITTSFLGVCLLFLIILNLLYNIHKRKKIEKKLLLTYNNMENLLDEKTKEIHSSNKELNKKIQESIAREKLLKLSEEKFRLMAENLPGVIYLKNKKTSNYVYLNEDILLLTGYHKNIFMNKEISIQEICHKDDISILNEIQKKITKKNKSFHCIYRIKNKNSEWHWIEEFGTGIFNKNKLEYIEGYLKDITEKKRTEETIEENLKKYRTLFDLSPTGILIEDKNGTILDVNEAKCVQTGFTKNELVGKNVSLLSPPTSNLQVKDNIKKLMKGEKLSHTVTSINKNKEKRYFELHEQRIPIKGRKKGIIVVSTDITERKTMEDTLERARILLQSSLEQISAGVLLADAKDGQIILANNEASNILGQSVQSFYKISFSSQNQIQSKQYDTNQKLIKNSDSHLTKAILNGETTQNVETKIKRKDGSEKWILSNAAPIKDYKNNTIAGIVVFSDISKSKELEQEKEKLIEKLKKALEEVKALSGLLPICASCKKIRDDKGYWNQIELYISERSQAQFSHGICPDCLTKLYPTLYSKDNNKK